MTVITIIMPNHPQHEHEYPPPFDFMNATEYPSLATGVGSEAAAMRSMPKAASATHVEPPVFLIAGFKLMLLRGSYVVALASSSMRL